MLVQTVAVPDEEQGKLLRYSGGFGLASESDSQMICCLVGTIIKSIECVVKSAHP